MLVLEVSAARPIFYSFRDLLALRTFPHLPEDASLEKIRKAIGTLRDLGDLNHLATYRLASDRRGNIQLIQGDEAAADLWHPGQHQLLVAIGDVIEPFPVRLVHITAVDPRYRFEIVDPAKHAPPTSTTI